MPLWLVLVVPARAAPRAAVHSTPHPAVARIIVPERGATAFGSGTLVDVREQFGLVITNWHVVRDATGRIEVVFPNGFRSFARAIKVDRDWDLAALTIWRPDIRPVPLAHDPPRPGDVLTIAGYGQGDYREAMGRCTQYLSPSTSLPLELVELSAEARQGDSGGPILNQRGELAGVLFGASYGTTMGSYAGRVYGFLASVAPDLGDHAAQIVAVVPRQPAPATANQGFSAPLARVERPRGASQTRPPPTASPHRPLPEIPPTQLADNPPPRRPAATLEQSAATTTKPMVAVPNPSPLAGDGGSWSDLAGVTLLEQIKTALAILGLLALVLWTSRLFAAAA